MSEPRICAKIGHATSADASGQKVAVKGKHGHLNVYKCPHCELWHIGRGRKKPVKVRRRGLRFEGLEDDGFE